MYVLLCDMYVLSCDMCVTCTCDCSSKNDVTLASMTAATINIDKVCMGVAPYHDEHT